ncbi:MAG: hypothetical protein H6977_06165 [Gammaproteobacteria bacterium]|nr:hypothetical protein [Gammaproteobacteria bacterium]MCP5199576.1 hypothetical protein [Gammaproteobacteria bacterium]
MRRIDRPGRRLMPRWWYERAPDDDHPHRRRFTARYRRKQGLVKNVWIASGVVMLLQASPALMLATALGTTFLAFVILDETP